MFAVGDVVMWKSQSKGFKTMKEGIIVAVVPLGTCPLEDYYCKTYSHNLMKLLGPDWHKRYSAKKLGGGGPRGTDSYLVNVKGYLYWPHVRNLVCTGRREDAKT